jgi:hypothetical protein
MGWGFGAVLGGSFIAVRVSIGVGFFFLGLRMRILFDHIMEFVTEYIFLGIICYIYGWMDLALLDNWFLASFAFCLCRNLCSSIVTVDYELFLYVNYTYFFFETFYCGGAPTASLY